MAAWFFAAILSVPRWVLIQLAATVRATWTQLQRVTLWVVAVGRVPVYKCLALRARQRLGQDLWDQQRGDEDVRQQITALEKQSSSTAGKARRFLLRFQHSSSLRRLADRTLRQAEPPPGVGRTYRDFRRALLAVVEARRRLRHAGAALFPSDPREVSRLGFGAVLLIGLLVLTLPRQPRPSNPGPSRIDMETSPDQSMPSEFALFAPDSEQFVILNLRQFIDSQFFKKYLKAELQREFEQPETKQSFDAVGLNLLTDVDRITLAGPLYSPSIPQSRTLIIVSGRFDIKKITAALEEASQQSRSDLTMIRERSLTLFKWRIPREAEPMDLYFAFADDKRIVLATNPKYLADTLARAARGEKWHFAKKDMVDAVVKVDKTSTFYVHDTSGLRSGIPGFFLENSAIGKLLEKTVSGTIDLRVTDGIHLIFSLNTKDADTAKDLEQLADHYLTQLKMVAPLAMESNPALKPLVMVLVDSMKIATRGSVLVVEAKITAQELENLGTKKE